MGRRISELTEVLTVDVDQDYIVIQRGSDNRKLKVANMMGSTNVGENFVDLKSHDNDEEYRLIINTDGKLQVFPKDTVEGHVYAPGENLRTPLKTEKIVVGAMAGTNAATGNEASATLVDGHGIVINQAYGGGNSVPTDTSQGVAVSHSFVELYNCSNTNTVNLCGLYLHYRGSNDAAWKTLSLRGAIPPRHSFLIRGKQHGNMSGDMIICKIYDYDQEWIDEQTGKPIALSDSGMSLYLSTNSTAPTDNPTVVTKIVDATGAVTETRINQDYVDLLGVGAAGTNAAPPAYNKFFHNCMNKDTAIRRIDFKNNKNNKYDTKPINYRKCKVEDVRPRSLRDGRWEQSADKIKPKDNIPNLVNITFGKRSSTRIFTWQSTVTDSGEVRLRKLKNIDGTLNLEPWIQVESKREIVNNHGVFMTIHRAQVDNLDPGLYEYKCGEPGYWSDNELLEIKEYNDNSNIRLLLTTDQQGFTEPEYEAWNTCVQAMRKENNFYDANGLPNFDFHVNCGDISQNASNLFEWLYYTKHANEFMKNVPHMTTCGNNDLVDKKYGFAYEHYATYEDQPMLNDYHKDVKATVDQPMVSTYSFDLGYTHFVCLNSNEEQMYNDYGIDKTEFLLKQAYFFDRDLWEVSKRGTKPKWVVVYAHLSPFSVTRAKRLQHWIPVLEHYGVDLFMCGHNHSYNRSIPIKCGYEKAAYADMISEANYNTYVTKTKTYTVKNETKLDGSEIDRTAHPADGTYYILFQASGSKISGKEKAIPLNNLTMVDKSSNPINASSGEAYTKHFSASAPTRPWWYDYGGVLMLQPSFATIDITKDRINVVSKYVPGVVSTDKETGIVTVSEYKDSMVPVQHDTLTINFADRRPAYRTGVTAPYYNENKTS